MRENEPSKSSSKNRGIKRKVATIALAGALLTPTSGSANETKSQDKLFFTTELSDKTSTNQQSEINWDNAVNGLEHAGDKEISQKEIQEFMKNHKKELVENIDKQVAEELYKEIIADETIQEVIKDLVNDADIRQAVLDGNEEYIKQEIARKIISPGERLLPSLIAGILVYLIGFWGGRKS